MLIVLCFGRINVFFNFVARVPKPFTRDTRWLEEISKVRKSKKSMVICRFGLPCLALVRVPLGSKCCAGSQAGRVRWADKS